MKKLIFIMVAVMSLNVFANVEQSDIDNKALEILLANSGRMGADSESGEQSVASLLAMMMPTGNTSQSTITNNCRLNASKTIFECSLNILNSDNPGEGGTESSLTIIYKLKVGKDGLPSEKQLQRLVEAMLAG
jgi:hypothetical protein